MLKVCTLKAKLESKILHSENLNREANLREANYNGELAV